MVSETRLPRSSTGSRFLAVVLLVLAGISCDRRTGPSEGVTLYEHPNFEGDARTFDGSFNDLDFVEGPCRGFLDPSDQPGDWEGCVSSVRITPGWEATLYEHDDYEGDSLVVTSDIRDLDDFRGCGGDWDNCTSSLQVRPPR